MAQRICVVEGCGRPHYGKALCKRHYERWTKWGTTDLVSRTLPAGNRFWLKVDKDGPSPDKRPDLGPCWLWTGQLDRYGYGKFKVEGKHRTAHKWAFEDASGLVPAGLTLDHLCRVRRCVRPSHMEPVSNAENVRRGEVGRRTGAALRARTHCIHGHLFDEANTIFRGPKRYRICRACAQLRRQRAA